MGKIIAMNVNRVADGQRVGVADMGVLTNQNGSGSQAKPPDL